MTTGQRATPTRLFETLPRKAALKAPRPREPTTISSASSSSARSASRSAGRPTAALRSASARLAASATPRSAAPRLFSSSRSPPPPRCVLRCRRRGRGGVRNMLELGDVGQDEPRSELARQPLGEGEGGLRVCRSVDAADNRCIHLAPFRYCQLRRERTERLSVGTPLRPGPWPEKWGGEPIGVRRAGGQGGSINRKGVR
jgi:hypothetical protein